MKKINISKKFLIFKKEMYRPINKFCKFHLCFISEVYTYLYARIKSIKKFKIKKIKLFPH